MKYLVFRTSITIAFHTSYAHRFINVSDTDELKSKLLDIWPFEKKGYKIISLLGSVKKFQGIVECSVLVLPKV